MIQQCRQVKLKAVQQGDAAVQEHCQKCVQQWQGIMDDMIDTQTASILQVQSPTHIALRREADFALFVAVTALLFACLAKASAVTPNG